MPRRHDFDTPPKPVSESWWATPKVQASRAEFDAEQAKRQTALSPLSSSTSTFNHAEVSTRGRHKKRAEF